MAYKKSLTVIKMRMLPGMECTNTPGSYVCSCPEGTLWDLEQCEDVNECLTNPCPKVKCLKFCLFSEHI